jgi:hypothetical protein
MGIEAWSTTAGSNNSAAPNGFPEGMPPSGVNDAARQVMASVRTWYQDSQWVNLGYTHVYVASTQFKIAGTDVTAFYPVGRRVKITGATTGTIYRTITVSSFSTDTTITVDAATIQSETLTVSVGALTMLDNALPLLANYSFRVNTVAASGTTETLDISLYNVHDVTLSDNCTFTFSNPKPSGQLTEFALLLRQDGTGGRSTTWPASVDWGGGTAPTLVTTLNSVSLLSFCTVDGGTIWHGKLDSSDSK